MDSLALRNSLPDIQNSPDTRSIFLHKVGIKELRYPIVVLDKNNGTQQTAATVDLAVSLPHNFKGTHMSRFIEVFRNYSKNLSMQKYLAMLEELCINLDAADAFGDIRFPYFIEKQAPVSKEPAIMSYDCAFDASLSVKTGERRFDVKIIVPMQTVCPCSKEISAYGAHNQRGEVRVSLRLGSFFWIEDLCTLVEEAASGSLYTLLKREDEKYVTEHAYDNPKFVEDVVRDVCLILPQLGDFPYCHVEVENFESIHNHNAFASTEGFCQAGSFLQNAFS